MAFNPQKFLPHLHEKVAELEKMMIEALNDMEDDAFMPGVVIGLTNPDGKDLRIALLLEYEPDETEN